MSGKVKQANGVASRTESSELLDSLIDDLETLRILRSDTTGDFEFLVGASREKIKAHRLILLARCEKFKAKNKQWLTQVQPTPSLVLEGFSVPAVEAVIRYLYTGQIDLHTEDTFQILKLCMELGLPKLQSHVRNHIHATLSPENVCSILVKATVNVQEESSKDSSLSQEISQTCLAYIEANSRVVFQSKEFLQLTKELLIAVISSNKLTVSEEDIWRSVVRWGQFHAQVKSTMLLWSEDDRKQIQAMLVGVLDHVHIMQINSEVFAKEVEPTGLLPMEMTLARYRQAAVTGKKGGSIVDVSRPRSGVQDPFPSSEILAGRTDLQVLISEWTDLPSQEWVLLYRGSRDGFHARQFHSCCDEKGATVSIIKTPSGCVFGGYTDANWSSRFKRGKFASSLKSFIFMLVNSSNTSPAKFEIKQPAYAINNHPANGPIYGSGADLCISSDCNKNKDSYCQLPYSYGDPSLPQYLLTGEQYFSVEDYEVFAIVN